MNETELVQYIHDVQNALKVLNNEARATDCYEKYEELYYCITVLKEELREIEDANKINIRNQGY